MGRKIPAKKHRGVKDPVEQQARRLASLKGKINAPPKDPDDQPVPKSLQRLFAFQDEDSKKSGSKKKIYKNGRRTRDKDDGAQGEACNPVSRLRRLPGESGRGFSLRINSAVRALHSPAEQLHYPLDVEVEDEKGLRMSEQRERRARKRRQAARAAADLPPGQAEPRLTRPHKLALKRKAKKIKAAEASSERREVVYDHVSFGEVTHAPPTLHFKRKGNVAASAGAARPGRRALLLAPLLAGGAAAAELRRQDAVAAYRALKASKRKLQ